MMRDRNSFIKQDIFLEEYHQRDLTIAFYKLFLNKVTLLKVFRRFDCPHTRKEALALSKNKKLLASIGVNLIGVGFDVAGAKAFVDGGYWNSELYLDPDRVIYRSLGLPKKNWLKSNINALKREKNKDDDRINPDIEGEQFGHSFQAGNTYLISSKGKILFSDLQNPVSIYSDIKGMLETTHHYRNQTVYFTGLKH